MIVYRVLKRVIDIVLSLLLIVLTFPILFVISGLILIESGFPILSDAPLRIGKGGGEFKMFKFRSMIIDAHRKLKSDSNFAVRYEEWKLNDGKLNSKIDPRVTLIGRVIRRLDLDELPQLFNVLFGQMSMVGPRAYFSEEFDMYKKRHPEVTVQIREIIKVKPGITGLWQVSGRNDIKILERFMIDSFYATNFNILLDLKILLKTPFVVLSRKGAIDR